MQMVGLKKIDLKVELYCMKCAEIVLGEIREVPGELSRTNLNRAHCRQKRVGKHG